MAKLAATIRPGDRLQQKTVTDKAKQVVHMVLEDYRAPHTVTLIMTSGDEFTFRLTEPVVFPRRQDGTNHAFKDPTQPLPVTSIFVGDLIAPYEAQAEPALSDMWLVKRIFATEGGYELTILTHSGDGEFLRFFVPEENAGDIYLAGSRAASRTEASQKPPRASGWYLDLDDNKIRFQLPGVIGRPPARAVKAAASVGTSWWEQYELVEGEIPHPNDPRYQGAS